MEFLAQQFGPDREPALAGPLGLFITVFLVVVTVFLIKGMSKHLRRLNERVAREAAMEANATEPVTESGAGPERS